MAAANTTSKHSAWLILAVSSGTCAAINGAFAKLTTTALTSTWSASLSTHLGLPPTFTNFALRALFFGLNIAFNILMWSLFTAALTRATSATRVSVVNVSANFMITAMIGAAVFGEKLGGRWWIGAALLAVGCVVIGRRDETEVGPKLPDGSSRSTGILDGTEEEEEVLLADVDGERHSSDADSTGRESEDCRRRTGVSP